MSLKLTSQILRDCDSAEADLQSYPDEQRRRGLSRVGRIRVAASVLADACFDGVATIQGHEEFTGATTKLMRALADEPEESADPTPEFFEAMYSRLASILHLASGALSPEVFSDALAVLTALANLADTVRHGGDVEENLETFCDFSESVFDELQQALSGGGDER